MVSHHKVGQLWALTKSGLKDWLLQRISAVMIFFYFIFFVGFFINHPALTTQDWTGLFAHLWMKVASLFVLIMILIHAWIGIWTVLTDYVHCSGLRGLIQFLIFVVLFGCFICGVSTMWG